MKAAISEARHARIRGPILMPGEIVPARTMAQKLDLLIGRIASGPAIWSTRRSLLFWDDWLFNFQSSVAEDT